MASGMIPFLWGPIAWRQIHGMAHQFDTRPQVDMRVADLFILFLIELAWVLPCKTCRTSYSGYLNQYLERNSFGKRGIDAFFEQHNVQRFAFDLHNTVNLKLGKPIAENFELVTRRSELWCVEFLPRELFGLLFIIVLNYAGNSEPDKEKHHRRLFILLPDLLFGLGEDRMAVALETTAVGSLPVITQETLLQALYDAYSDWFLTSEVGDVPTLDEVQYKYNLCRNA